MKIICNPLSKSMASKRMSGMPLIQDGKSSIPLAPRTIFPHMLSHVSTPISSVCLQGVGFKASSQVRGRFSSAIKICFDRDCADRSHIYFLGVLWVTTTKGPLRVTGSPRLHMSKHNLAKKTVFFSFGDCLIVMGFEGCCSTVQSRVTTLVSLYIDEMRTINARLCQALKVCLGKSQAS
jgi:hypothetical protein